MIIVLELAGIAALGFVIWILFRASRARPEDNGLRFASRVGLAAWAVFAIWTLVDFGSGWKGILQQARTIGILLLIFALAYGYFFVIGRLRDKANDGSS